MPLRCVIVDDNPSFREEVGRLLREQGLNVVATAASGDEAIHQIDGLGPDVVLIDIDLGAESGLDLARRLRDVAGPDSPRMILISTHDEREYDDLIAASPAVGFLAKMDISAAAIRSVLDAASSSDARRDT